MKSNKPKEIFKGLFIGLGAILPGISGSMIAASFNVYDKLIAALNSFTKTPINAIRSVWQYILGIIIGILVGIYLISTIFNIIPIPITLFFIGLIIGSIPKIYYLTNLKNDKYNGIITAIISFLIMILINFIPNSQGFSLDGNIFMWIIIGFLIALALITPGFSVATLLLMIGGYFPLIGLAKVLMKAVIDFDFNVIMNHILSVIILLISIIASLIILGKIINKVIIKYKDRFYQIVLGLTIAAPINILIELNDELLVGEPVINIFDFNTYWHSWMIGILLIPFAIIVINNLFKEEEKEDLNLWKTYIKI